MDAEIGPHRQSDAAFAERAALAKRRFALTAADDVERRFCEALSSGMIVVVRVPSDGCLCEELSGGCCRADAV